VVLVFFHAYFSGINKINMRLRVHRNLSAITSFCLYGNRGDNTKITNCCVPIEWQYLHAQEQFCWTKNSARYKSKNNFIRPSK